MATRTPARVGDRIPLTGGLIVTISSNPYDMACTEHIRPHPTTSDRKRRSRLVLVFGPRHQRYTSTTDRPTTTPGPASTLGTVGAVAHCPDFQVQLCSCSGCRLKKGPTGTTARIVGGGAAGTRREAAGGPEEVDAGAPSMPVGSGGGDVTIRAGHALRWQHVANASPPRRRGLTANLRIRDLRRAWITCSARQMSAVCPKGRRQTTCPAHSVVEEDRDARFAPCEPVHGHRDAFDRLTADVVHPSPDRPPLDMP